jgi:hypothetical protein
MRYNIGGINLSEQAFKKLSQEIALAPHNVPLPTLWEDDAVELHSGVVALGSGMSHKLIVREARIPHVEARDFHLIEWTGRRYYEVVTNETIYEYLQNVTSAKAQAANA